MGAKSSKCPPHACKIPECTDSCVGIGADPQVVRKDLGVDRGQASGSPFTDGGRCVKTDSGNDVGASNTDNLGDSEVGQDTFTVETDNSTTIVLDKVQTNEFEQQLGVDLDQVNSILQSFGQPTIRFDREIVVPAAVTFEPSLIGSPDPPVEENAGVSSDTPVEEKAVYVNDCCNALIKFEKGKSGTTGSTKCQTIPRPLLQEGGTVGFGVPDPDHSQTCNDWSRAFCPKQLKKKADLGHSTRKVGKKINTGQGGSWNRAYLSSADRKANKRQKQKKVQFNRSTQVPLPRENFKKIKTGHTVSTRPAVNKRKVDESGDNDSDTNDSLYKSQVEKREANQQLQFESSLGFGLTKSRYCVERHVCGTAGAGHCYTQDGYHLGRGDCSRTGQTSTIRHQYRSGFIEGLEQSARRRARRAGITVTVGESQEREVASNGRLPETLTGYHAEQDKRNQVLDRFRQSQKDFAGPPVRPSAPPPPTQVKQDHSIDYDSDNESDKGGPYGVPGKNWVAYRDATERALREALGLNEVVAKTLKEQEHKEVHLKKVADEYMYNELDRPHDEFAKQWPDIYPNLEACKEWLERPLADGQ